MIKIIDYGLGNLSAFVNAYKILNKKVQLLSSESDFKNVSHLILPGVGSYDYAMQLLQKSNLIPSLNEYVLVKKIPILGVCVGMQIMGKRSDEGVLEGLSWIKGEVKSLMNINKNIMLHHMGCNSISVLKEKYLLRNLKKDPNFYFLHSYFFKCNDQKNIISTSFYANDFTCAINDENIYGVQFHPEKSHFSGLQILKNFSEL